uniref:phenylalanine--tRNA ligase n=1 Tax=Hommersandiophycus borowitzkae TaxID=268573 RepID=A0A1G4NUD9_9FLOR|nr:Phenylalanine-tRNA ligase beta subunit [Hommersandiophycus borowitzkae]SCW22257.1 Phenylalanine-tRNA ligase beta subunit [Hommersandiophycus borowitzkae]
MNISWKWLEELVELHNIDPKQLAARLTSAGFEIENLTDTPNQDTIINITHTANRSDIVSLISLVREISSILKQKLKIYQIHNNVPVYKKSIPLYYKNYGPVLLSKLYNVKIQESPKWLKEKLAVYDITSVNNLTDIINFITIKWAFHIKIYEMNNIDTDINTEYQSILKQVSKVASKPSISTNTKLNILLHLDIPTQDNQITQTTFFNSEDPEYIQQLDKSTNTYNKYDILDAYNESLLLVTKFCNTSYPNQIIYLSEAERIYKPIQLNYNRTVTFLGPIAIPQYKTSSTTTYINKYEIHNIFHHLYFHIHSNITQCYVDIPSYRIRDIEREIDLIEEISRIYGFDKFIDKLPYLDKKGIQSPTKYRINHIRSVCRSIGLHEVIHSSLNNSSKTQIYNPLTKEYNSLRYGLLPNLIKSSIYNIKQSKQYIEMFEIGRIFIKHNHKYTEKIHLAGIFGGNRYTRSQWYEQPANISWFQAKGDIEEILERLSIKVQWYKNIISSTRNIETQILETLQTHFKNNYYSILYTHNNVPIGIFGEINSIHEKHKDPESLYGFEFILESIMHHEEFTHTQRFQQYTKYPSIVRDIKINVPKGWPMQKVFDMFNDINEPLIESIKLFDVYDIEQTDLSYKSLGFRITYSNHTSTLTNQEVNEIENRLKTISIN